MKLGGYYIYMKYRWSPVNIFVLVSTVLLMVSTLSTNSPFGGLLILLYLTPLFILGLVIDCVLQIFLSDYRRIVIIELIVIIIGLMLLSTFLK